MKIFFATDVHGSEICWKKFINAGKFYETEVLILGGDMTGKAIVPIIAQGEDKYKVTLLEQETIPGRARRGGEDGPNHPEPGLLPLRDRTG